MLVQNCVKFPLIVTSRLLREEGEGRLFVRPHHRPMSALRPKSVSRKETGSEVVTATIYNREAALLFFFWSFSIFISRDPVGSVSLDRVTGQRRPESLRSGLDARSARWRPVPDGFPKSAPPNSVRGLEENAGAPTVDGTGRTTASIHLRLLLVFYESCTEKQGHWNYKKKINDDLCPPTRSRCQNNGVISTESS